MKSFVNLLLFILCIFTFYELPWDSHNVIFNNVFIVGSIIYSLLIGVLLITDSFKYEKRGKVRYLTTFILLINSITLTLWNPNWVNPSFFNFLLIGTLLYSVIRMLMETIDV